VVNGTVTERVKGGLRVDVGVPGFVPASHVAVRNPRVLDRFVGHTLRLKVLEADRAANKVILSHRQVIEEERERRRQETLSRLQEGMVCEGKVRNITNYGSCQCRGYHSRGRAQDRGRRQPHLPRTATNSPRPLEDRCREA